MSVSEFNIIVFVIADYIQLLRKRQKIKEVSVEASIEGEKTNNNEDEEKLVNNKRWEDFRKKRKSWIWKIWNILGKIWILSLKKVSGGKILKDFPKKVINFYFLGIFGVGENLERFH